MLYPLSYGRNFIGRNVRIENFTFQQRLNFQGKFIMLRAREDSNLQPLGPQPSVLSIELRAHSYDCILAY